MNTQNDSISIRVAIICVGDVACNLGYQGIDGMLDGQAHILFLNTNEHSRKRLEGWIKKNRPGLTVTIHAVGEDLLPEQTGTGKDPVKGDLAMKELIEEKRYLSDWLDQHPVEAVLVMLGYGDGGTGRGGGARLIRYLKFERRLVVVPIIATASYKSREVTSEQSTDIETRLDAFTKDKISFLRGMTSNLYKIEGMTKTRAFSILSRAVSGPVRGISRMLNEPFDYDHMNFLTFYTNPEDRRRPWLMTTATIDEKGFSEKEAARAAAELLDNRCTDFRLKNISRTLLIIEGEPEARMHTAVKEHLYKKVDEIYFASLEDDAAAIEKAKTQGSPDFQPEEANFPHAGENGKVRYTLWATEKGRTATHEEIKELSNISWLKVNYDSPDYGAGQPVTNLPEIPANADTASIPAAGSEPDAQHEAEKVPPSDAPPVQAEPADVQLTPEPPQPPPPPMGAYTSFSELVTKAASRKDLTAARICQNGPGNLPKDDNLLLTFSLDLNAVNILTLLPTLDQIAVAQTWKDLIVKALQKAKVSFMIEVITPYNGIVHLKASDNLPLLRTRSWWLQLTESTRKDIETTFLAARILGNEIVFGKTPQTVNGSAKPPIAPSAAAGN